MQALILLIASLFNSGADQATIDATLAAQQTEYTATYDASSGGYTVSNPDGSIIVIDPDEAN